MSWSCAKKRVIIIISIIAIAGCGSGGGTGTGNSRILTWTAPTTTMDGSPLTNPNSISGYKVYYGTSPGNYTSSAVVGNVTTYTVTGLSGGTTYYFAVTASNASGESGYSNEVNRAIP